MKDHLEKIRKILEEDPELYRGWRDNIAMRLYDEQQWNGKQLNFRNKETRDRVACKLLDLIFRIKK